MSGGPSCLAAGAVTSLHRATIAVVVTLALVPATFGMLACGGPAQPSGPILSLDAKIEHPDGIQTILGATLLLDGKEVARFTSPRPESMVVFSKIIEGVAPGEHVVEVRVDAQTDSPAPYGAGGFANYAGKRHPLMGVGGTVATGQSLRFELEL